MRKFFAQNHFARTQQETIHQAKSVSNLKERLSKDSSDCGNGHGAEVPRQCG